MRQIRTQRAALVTLLNGSGVLIELGWYNKAADQVVFSIKEAPFFIRPRWWGQGGLVFDSPWAMREVFGIELYFNESWLNGHELRERHEMLHETVENYMTMQVADTVQSLFESGQLRLFSVVIPVTRQELHRPKRQEAIFRLHCSLRDQIEDDNC